MPIWQVPVLDDSSRSSLPEETLRARATVSVSAAWALAPTLASFGAALATVSPASTPGPVRNPPGDGPAAVLGPTEVQKSTKAQGEADRTNLARGILLRVLPGNIRGFRTPESVRWCFGIGNRQAIQGCCQDLASASTPFSCNFILCP